MVTEPSPTVQGTALPAALLLNSGLLHHVGANRLHVQLARTLAPLGLATLRFDFSGIGDSEARRDGLAFEKSAVLEVGEAMDYLERTRGSTTFVLMGLCSGADMAFATALGDDRVVGLVQLDPYAYRTWQYYLHRYGPRLLSGKSWWNVLSGRTYVGPFLRRRLGSAGDPELGADAVISPYMRQFPPKEAITPGLRTLVGRGVRLLHVFSGGMEDHYSYRDQYMDTFRSVDFRGQLRVEYLADADHIFTSLGDQAFVVTTIRDWARANWVEPAAIGARVPG